jgi:uncharacterized protein YbjT (DUF2867 family)
MRAVLFGATGMIGSGVLLECLADPRVESVLSISRSSTGRTHPKLREVVHADFLDFDPLRSELASCDACFFCLGVTSVGLSEAEYTRLTYDLTLAAARSMAAANANMTFCYVSGLGTDTTERGRTMWARVKGKTENAILELPFKAAFMFRPGFIQPVKGVRSKTAWYQAVYNVSRPISPLLLRLLPNQITTTEKLGRAMIEAVASGYPKRILYPGDINALAGTDTP